MIERKQLIKALDCCSSNPARCGSCPLCGWLSCINTLKREAMHALDSASTLERYKHEFERLMDLPNCNSCRESGTNACGCCPGIGEDVRINCPMWAPKKEANK